jgi:CBS domain-containing protein
MTGDLVREAPVLSRDTTVLEAGQAIVASGLPALPVVDEDGRLCGVFGERQFMTALFPGYVGQLGSAHYVSARLDEALEKRAACRTEPISRHMSTEEVAVRTDYSDLEAAEIFLHHRVAALPVIEDGRPVGVLARSDFFARLVERSASLQG